MTIKLRTSSRTRSTLTRVNNWWWYAFLYFLVGYIPPWMGTKRAHNTYYSEYTDHTGKLYLLDNEYGVIFERKAM